MGRRMKSVASYILYRVAWRGHGHIIQTENHNKGIINYLHHNFFILGDLMNYFKSGKKGSVISVYTFYYSRR